MRQMTELNLDAMDATRYIVCSYVANNPVSPTDLPGLISRVYSAMGGLGGTAPAAAPASIFGDGLMSEKSLDEVILAYLAEDLDEPKR